MITPQIFDDLRHEAALGKREDFEQFLKLVPDVQPLAGDENGFQPDLKSS